MQNPGFRNVSRTRHSGAGRSALELGNGTDGFGNLGGDWTGAIAGQLGVNGNFSLDPEYCPGESTLDRDSPCAPDNHPDNEDCGLIGAQMVNCGSVATEHETWGAIKALYRNH